MRCGVCGCMLGVLALCCYSECCLAGVLFVRCLLISALYSRTWGWSWVYLIWVVGVLCLFVGVKLSVACACELFGVDVLLCMFCDVLVVNCVGCGCGVGLVLTVRITISFRHLVLYCATCG